MSTFPLSPDAATVYGLAGTALAFAESADDEVERWLRPLRLYGRAGALLQRLAIGEAPLAESEDDPQETRTRPAEDTLSAIAAAASESATQRGALVVSTIDVLVAVMDQYPDVFERALKRRGIDPAELSEQLERSLAAPLV